MPGSLDDWQERLARHFSGLVAKRAGSGFPIFALEHDLTTAELRELSGLLHAYLRGSQNLRAYWLLWVVYATEQGYGYEGHEYWVSFEHNTPHWKDRGSPSVLRRYFEKFQETYNGVVPSGPWAEWFRNIAGPITHAILPRYLQEQFADALFDARHQFARLQNPNPVAAGKILASNTWNATSRFREFLEQEELAGRLALTLLDCGISQGVSPIYEPTLKRIVDDLSKIRSAGERLRDTRRFVADRFHGIDKGGGFLTRDGHGGRSLETTEPPSVRPSLMMRRSTEGVWSVVAEVPNYQQIARLNPDFSRFLKSTRCTLAGTDGAMLPAGWTLYGPQKRILKSWPPSGGMMISFEKHNALLENILGRECRFAQGPVWVFRIASDGIAYEVTSRAVRAGQRYLVVSRDALKPNLAFVGEAIIQCAGASCIELAMPTGGIEASDTNELRKIGIEVSRNIRLWPAGMSARNWDGEGHGDWLTTETPCFGIVHDHAIDEYAVRLDSGPELKIDGARAGHPVFVKLPRLQPGRHSLIVRAKRIGVTATSAALRDLEGRVELKVRDPSPWRPGTTGHSGLALSIDPPDPSLDAFWEGSVRLSVLGPEGREVTCAMSLTGRDGSDVLNENIGNFPLPITSSGWSKRFKSFANDDARAWKYLDASKGRFIIKGDELGEFVLPLERSSSPVRWLCRISHSSEVRLVDDSGRDIEPALQFFPFKQPWKSVDLEVAATVKGQAVSEPGGLYFAKQGELKDALVISASKGATGFADLVVKPDLSGLGQDPLQILALIDLWQQARVVGPLADSRRDHILHCLLERLYLALCGSRWSHAEDSFFRNGQNADLMQIGTAIKLGASARAYPAALRQRQAQMSQNTVAGVRWFAEVSGRYGVCTDPDLCSFALRLASKPFELAEQYGQELPVLLAKLRHNEPLMQAARYLALHSLAEDVEQTNAYLPRWMW